MTGRLPLYFALAFHDHQPVGNFDDVVARAHDRAYFPLLAKLQDYPNIGFSLHISGYLLEWMLARAPQTVELIRGAVRSGRCEVLTGTFYESLAPVAPRRDVLDSLLAYTDFLAAQFGPRPRGMWIAERVFDPALPELLAAASITMPLSMTGTSASRASIPPI